MTRYRLEIRVTPRPGLLDPEGQAIHHALNALGFAAVDEVRVGKAMYLDVDADSSDDAVERGEAMCRKLLANPVTEDFSIQVVGEGGATGGGETPAEPDGGGT